MQWDSVKEGEFLGGWKDILIGGSRLWQGRQDPTTYLPEVCENLTDPAPFRSSYSSEDDDSSERKGLRAEENRRILLCGDCSEQDNNEGSAAT